MTTTAQLIADLRQQAKDGLITEREAARRIAHLHAMKSYAESVGATLVNDLKR